MRYATWCASLLGVALLLIVSVGSANAQATRTWVSGVGDDVNPCSRTAPCKTFAGAISKTAAGGEISTLDPGGFGAVNITKSISITNDGAGEAGILASSTTGVIVNGAGIVVRLKGIVIDGGTPGLTGLHGIRFIQGAALHVENCVIKNFVSASAGAANGIIFTPASSTSQLFVSNTTILDNGSASGGTGIIVQPTGSGSALAAINKVQVENNRQGIRADTTATTGTVLITVRDSVIAGSSVSAVSAATKTVSPTTAAVMVDNSALLNSGAGIIVNGPAGSVLVGRSTIAGNGNAVTLANSGVVSSYKNNQIEGNTNNNTPLPQVNQN